MKTIRNKNLAYKINKMAFKDQKIRKKVQESEVWNDKIDKENTKQLKNIIQKYGWPTIKLVGKKTSKNAWLLVQHADHNIKFQKKCLKLMENALKKDGKSIAKENIAFLKDRILINEKKKQLFGTQFYFDKRKKIIPRPISDVKNLERRRKEYNLPLFKKFLLMAKSYNKKCMRYK